MYATFLTVSSNDQLIHIHISLAFCVYISVYQDIDLFGSKFVLLRFTNVVLPLLLPSTLVLLLTNFYICFLFVT